MRIALLVGRFPVLSQTFILDQIIGLIDRGYNVDIYADRPPRSTKMHREIESYDLLKRTYYRPRIPQSRVFRAIKALGLLLAKWSKNPGPVLRSLNFFKYGKRAGSLGLLYWAIPLLDKGRYDIIHCHFGPKGLMGVLLRDIGVLQGKLVTTFHGYDMSMYLNSFGDRIYERLFERGDLFLPISEYFKRRLIELGCDGKKIVVHRMGVKCREFSFRPRRLAADGRIRIVTIARLVEKKGVEYGIRAVAKVKELNQNIEYSIVGDGPLKEELKQLIHELHIADAVKLIGWKDRYEVLELLKDADILLAPSITSRNGDQEGIPVTLMEGMAMGLPVVSTEHSGIPELIDNGVSGYIVPERDVDALAEKMRYLIEHPEIWGEMGQAGRAYVEDHYNCDKLNDRLVEIYRELLM